MKSTLRTFIAVDIAPGIRVGVQKALRSAVALFPQIKWVEDEQFHVTLKFLGDVPAVELHKVIRSVERAVRTIPVYDLVFEGFGAFPNLTDPRTLWVGVSDGVAETRRLAAAIDEALAPDGYRRENRLFMPHLTVGRARAKDRISVDEDSETILQLGELLAKESTRDFGCSCVEEVTIYSSELSRNGPKYEVLASCPLFAGDE
ncbi:MAG: RNA 2',3'-cyclic phosphodiesterase [Planctomycetia bacterium]|nr:RNA 2',3'-cyclic phosphodiesterase [Planctomycetia bacterium]